MSGPVRLLLISPPPLRPPTIGGSTAPHIGCGAGEGEERTSNLGPLQEPREKGETQTGGSERRERRRSVERASSQERGKDAVVGQGVRVGTRHGDNEEPGTRVSDRASRIWEG